MQDIITVVKNLLESSLFRSVFWACVIFIATLVASRLAVRALRHVLRRDESPLPTVSIIANIVRAIIWIIGVSIILDSCFGINTSSVIAALGVGGIAVSLGFQDTLANLIGGLQVTLMGIVKPGDNIEVGSESGVVQDVTWRHTTIQDSMGQTVIVPNSIISTTALVHLLPANRVTVPFTIPRTSTGNDAAKRDAQLTGTDALSQRIIDCAREAASSVSPVVSGPTVYFAEIAELGIRGKVILQVKDAAQVSAAADAIVRALATMLG